MSRPSGAGGAFEDEKGRRRTDMRRKKRTRVTWFPLLGHGYSVGDASLDSWNTEFSTPLDPTVGEDVLIRPLVWDTPLEAGAAGGSDQAHQLVDFVGNEYVLKRMVGSAFGWIDSNETNPDPPNEPGPQAVQFVLGAFVARAGDTNDTLGADVPLGANNSPRSFSPDSLDTAREPWIFRKRWVIGNFSYGTVTGREPTWGANTFPTTTAEYGSVADGPKIDAKVGRRIGNDDRLFLSLSVKPFPLGVDWDAPTTGAFLAKMSVDLRILGSLRKAHNRSTF